MATAPEERATALERLRQAGASEAVVVSNDADAPKLLGILTREGALEAWRNSRGV